MSNFELTDEELIKKFQNGDVGAYNQIVYRYKDRLLNFIYRFLNDIDRAEDLVQDTLIKLYTHKDSYREIAKFSTWLYTIAANLARTELRKIKRRKTFSVSELSRDDREFIISSPDIEPDDENLAQIFEKNVQRALVKLPDDFPFRTFDIILRAEAGAFFDELLLSNKDDLMVEQTKRSRVNSLRQSRFIPAVEYLQANRHRSRLIESMHKLMKGYDVVISPQRGGNQILITNLTGHPAISVPAGFDEKGRPTSIILVGNLYDEASILTLANHFQDATDFHNKPPHSSGHILLPGGKQNQMGPSHQKHVVTACNCGHHI